MGQGTHCRMSWRRRRMTVHDDILLDFNGEQFRARPQLRSQLPDYAPYQLVSALNNDPRCSYIDTP